MQPGLFRSYFGAICVPTLDPGDGSITTVTHDWANASAGIGGGLAVTMLRLNVANRNVGVAKQALAEMAVANNCQFVFFLDDDVIVPGDALMKMIQLWRQDPKYQIINGVYWSKSEPPQPLIFKGSFEGSYWNWHVGDLIEADGAGAGCTFIATDVLKKLPKPWFSTEYIYNDPREQMDLNRWKLEDELTELLRNTDIKNTDIQERIKFLEIEIAKASAQMNDMKEQKGIDPRQLVGVKPAGSTTEDLYFYKKAKEVLGLSCWVDTSIQCMHQDKKSGRMFGIRPDFPQARPGMDIPVKTGKRMLDIGAGEVSPALQEYDIVTLDIDPDTKPNIVADARQLPIPDNSFDAVHASHCLEHFGFKWTKNILNEWIRVLKLGGKLMLVVPNLEWAAERILKSKTQRLDQFDAERSMFMFYSAQKDGGKFDYHKAGFTPNSMRDLINSIPELEIEVCTASDGAMGNWDMPIYQQGNYNVILIAKKVKNKVPVSIHKNLNILDQEETKSIDMDANEKAEADRRNNILLKAAETEKIITKAVIKKAKSNKKTK